MSATGMLPGFDVLPVVPPHPAPFPGSVLHTFARLLGSTRLKVLDPFAGTGRIHRLDHETVGVELEPEWAGAHPRTIAGNALNLPFPDGRFDACATSPAYGNRMADSYDGRDGSERHTYRVSLGRPLSSDSGAGLQWGPAYRDLHQRVWVEVSRVLKPEALMLVNVADHIRKGETGEVIRWHTEALAVAGFVIRELRPVPTTHLPHGANYELRTEGEMVIVATWPGPR